MITPKQIFFSNEILKNYKIFVRICIDGDLIEF